MFPALVARWVWQAFYSSFNSLGTVRSPLLLLKGIIVSETQYLGRQTDYP